MGARGIGIAVATTQAPQRTQAPSTEGKLNIIALAPIPMTATSAPAVQPRSLPRSDIECG